MKSLLKELEKCDRLAVEKISNESFLEKYFLGLSEEDILSDNTEIFQLLDYESQFYGFVIVMYHESEEDCNEHWSISMKKYCHFVPDTWFSIEETYGETLSETFCWYLDHFAKEFKNDEYMQQAFGREVSL